MGNTRIQQSLRYVQDFPMTVTIDSNGKFAVKNFLGEKYLEL